MSDSYEDENFMLNEYFYRTGRSPTRELNLGSSTLTPSLSYKSDGKCGGSLKKKNAKRSSLDGDDFITMLHGSDPVKLELNRLENELREKERELAEAHAEIKALKLSDRSKERAVQELTEELRKVDEKLKANGVLLENKNLEIKKLTDEKKAALAAQFAAEATMRRVHAAQKDDDMPPIEAILAPLEAELKLARQEISKLQEDNRALDRLTKSKEAALLDADRTVEAALAKASMVDDLQNRNQELMKQIEICQEENKILDKMHRQKVAEVEKLSQTVRELEEAVLAGGAAANAVREYQRKFQAINEEKKTLDRELARAKVTANRVATVVANEWKDGNDKVMPVKQWLEERRFLQGEMQQLRDKLAIVERAVKSEAQLKEKFQLRLKVLEEGLRSSPTGGVRGELRSYSNGRTRRQSLSGTENSSRLTSNGIGTRRSLSQQRGSFSSNSSTLIKPVKCNLKLDGDRSLIFERRSAEGNKPFGNGNEKSNDASKDDRSEEAWKQKQDNRRPECVETSHDDMVSGVLYDMLQKEVIALRKASHEKDQTLKDKDDAIEILTRKVETLNRAMEAESKKHRRDKVAMEKTVASLTAERQPRRSSNPRAALNSSNPRAASNSSHPRAALNSAQLFPSRTSRNNSLPE
eukprot:TRINITY_DN3539_c0_g2_i1.p1 TRINITY_DN3539_c0_g2~~TRINITY_DN3539_c0_g2_i1.p1  ORF type:complete len:640 (-),score=171.36 TRINITY_DN3539_c0_g2_i1:415-2334(-)